MSVPVATGSRLGRRADLRRRRRQQRRRAVGAALAVLLVLAVVVTVVLVQRGGTVSRREAVSVRTQQTLLLQVRGSDGSAVATALLAHDPAARSGAVVLVPPQVIAAIPGVGTVPFGKGLQTAPAASSRNALSDLLGVTVDGGWVLDTATLARLVDAEGGISADVDATVLSGRVVVLQPGKQQLDGQRALLYATYLAPKETEQARLSRLQDVLDGVLVALPKDPAALVGSLGGGSQPSLGAGPTGALLAGLAADDKGSELQYRSLPVVPITSGSDETTFRVDAAATASLVDELLAQSVPPGARTAGNRVLVLNGVGTPGLGEKVRAKLVPAGFVFVGAHNAEHLGYAQTQVLVPDGTTASIAVGTRVATALGLTADSVRTSASLGSISDVVVLVGGDFRP